MTLEEAVWEDPDHQSHAVCFRNTRIRVSTLYEYIADEDLDGFYRNYPEVTAEMIKAVVGFAGPGHEA